jgi:hypothetical protein
MFVLDEVNEEINSSVGIDIYVFAPSSNVKLRVDA